MPANDPAGSPRRPDERTDAREQTLVALYEAEQRKIPADAALTSGERPFDALTASLIRGIVDNGQRIDSLIEVHSKGWSLHRMPAIDRAILRIGTYELVDRPDTPVAVVIDEAVELAKRFSTDDSGRFVNGVLAAIARKVRPSVD